MDNVLRRLLTVCGEIMVVFLGVDSGELASIARVARTFQYGVFFCSDQDAS